MSFGGEGRFCITDLILENEMRLSQRNPPVKKLEIAEFGSPWLFRLVGDSRGENYTLEALFRRACDHFPFKSTFTTQGIVG